MLMMMEQEEISFDAYISFMEKHVKMRLELNDMRSNIEKYSKQFRLIQKTIITKSQVYYFK